MPLSFNHALGPHEHALMLKARRAEVLGANLTNADTPNFKARDIDFKTALKQAGASGSELQTTHHRHIAAPNKRHAPQLLYRIPEQPSVDGNTVDSRVEQAEFAENALQYQASLTFLSKKFNGLRAAIRGE